MCSRWSLKLLFFSVFYLASSADDSGDQIWLLIDHIQVNECQGVTNQATLAKEDVQVLDKNGKLALYFEAPNEYTVNINNIKVKRPLPNLSGEVAATIQVPLVSAGVLSLDYPFQIYPQKKLLEGSQCDNESGVINDQAFRREYCRYCELCDAGVHAENRVDADKHNVVHKDPNDNIEKKCYQIDAQSYNIKKSFHVPGKREIEQEVNSNKGKVDESLNKKLEAGKGKFDIYLQLYSSDQAPKPARGFYASNKGCECCAKDQQGNTNCKPGIFGNIAFLGGGNPCPKCNNNYAASCFQGTPQKVACWTVTFNFRVTNKSSDVAEFEQQVEYNKHRNAKNYNEVSSSANTNANALSVGSGNSNKSNPKPSSGGNNDGRQPNNGGSGSGPRSCGSCDRDRCTGEITFPPTRNYCTNWWTTSNARPYCCSKCPKSCTRD